MSHYADMEIEFDVEHEAELVECLEGLFGQGHIELHPEGASLFGYGGDDRSKANKNSRDYAPPCEIVIRRKHVGSASNDIGFKRVEGKYKGYVSDFDSGHHFSKAKQEAVAQEYGLKVAENTLKQQGWKQIFRTKLEDGSVKVTAKGKVELGLKNW